MRAALLALLLITPASADTPFIVQLPDGSELLACNPRFEVAPMKRFTFSRCETIFADSFGS